MAGPNQHYIPKQLLKGFTIKGARKFAWEYRSGVPPERRRIKKIASDDYFYSDDEPDEGLAKLDDEITAHENVALARQLGTLRCHPTGTEIDSRLAAEVISHLGVRNESIRSGIANSIKLMAKQLHSIVSNERAFGELIGLHGREPTSRFKRSIDEIISRDPTAKKAGLPDAVLARVAYCWMREQLPTMHRTVDPHLRSLFANLHSSAGDLARNSHIKALMRGVVPEERVRMLSELQWRLVDSPASAVLPDCVAIGLNAEGEAQPFFFIDTESLATIVMPINTKRLLLGRREDAPEFDPILFNLHAISCSEAFFVSSVEMPEFAEWSRYIGVRSRAILQKSLSEILEIQVSQAADRTLGPNTDSEPRLPQYQVQFIRCIPESSADEVCQVVHAVAQGISETIPLSRLDGITFAEDYSSAVADPERGFLDEGHLSTYEEPGAMPAAVGRYVDRSVVTRVHVILRGALARHLISKDDRERREALQILVQQLAEVGCVELYERALPGLLGSTLRDSFDSIRYRCVSDAWGRYFGARVSASFAPETGDYQRAFLVSALARAREQIPQARVDYRFHGDVSKMMEIVLLHVKLILQHGAQFLGHYDGVADVNGDPNQELVNELSRQNLTAWFELYHRDLVEFWKRRDRWSSLDEFLLLTLHVERLLFQFGLFLWQTPEGECRVEAPVSVDALSLRREIWRRPMQTAKLIYRRLRAAQSGVQNRKPS